ncbi:Ankyrin-3 [Didymella heteroderae]|uniref:Ankyrin-3 n=1 Tax=Didymella heteroderae TaxID=1769908 RepID=A0A9P4WSP4_9PLEO|nr:Ankyrin-3 [Didymella heteroderae]
MAALKRDRLAQAGHQFSGRIQNSDHGAQLLGNFNVGGNITFHQSSGQSHQERLRECRKALHLGRSDPHDDRAKIIAVKTKTGRIIAASCEWITMHLRYRSWESPSTGSRLLWISSDEGLGKTMTAIYLTQKLEETATKGKDSTVVYFFIERQDKKNTAVDVLCGLLLRLLAARKDSDELTEHLLEEHDLQKDALFEKDAIEALWRLFVKMITDRIAGQVYCIIDGLDNYEEIEEDYGGESLRQYIKVRLDELIAERKWSVEASNYVNASLEYLWYRGDDTFLWVDFAIEEVRKAAGDAASIESVLISLPPTLTEMYSYILRKIPQNLVELVADLLRWSVCARQPMKVLELTVALKLTSHGRGAAKQLILNAVSACGNMLMVNAEDDTVNIVHNSLVDFLSADSSPIHQDARLATFIVRTSKIHNDIANSCIAYLEGGCLEKGSICRKENEVTFNQRLAQFPFMAYAMAHWPNHLQDAGTPRLDFSSPFFQHKSKIRKNWWHTYWAEYTGDSILFAPMNFTLLHLAGHRGLVYIAQQMLQHGELQARLDKRDSHGYTPLEYSVMYGHMQMFQYLTDIGATQKDSAETLLELACRGGQQEIAERLIQRGFDVNMRAQSRSVKESVYKATKFLPGTITEGLAWRIVNRYFGEHETPLVTAAMYGHSAVVGMLLDRGAIIDAETTKGYTPLHAASDQGQTECVETLLERGARVAARTSEGWTALHFAAWRGKLPVVKIFLNMGLNLDMMTTKSKTPLHLAAYEGQADVVRALVDRGAYMEHISHKGETPLHLATRNGKPQVVEILLSRGANRDAMTKEGKTPCKIGKGSKTTVGKECMRILQTFGTPGYQPWKPPKGADADAGSDTGLDDYNDEATKSIQDSLRKGSQASVNLQSSLAAKAARVLSPKVEFQAKLDLKALNQPPAQNRMLSRVQSEPIYGPSRFSYQSAANYTISPAQQYVLDDAPPPYMPPVSGSTSQVPGISLEKSPAVTVSRKALHQTTWQAPPQVQEYSSPSATPVMGQSQYMPPENPYQAVKQPYAQPSMVQMINSMSLKSGSAPDPTAPVTSTAPHHQVAAPGSPFTYANHFDRSSYSPMPTFQARVFPDSLRFHAAAASVMAPSQPTDPMQQLPPPQRLQHNPQQDFAHHRSHTVPIVQQTQPYQQPYQQSHRQPPQQQQQYSAAYPSLYTTSSPQPPQNYAYIPPTTQSPQFTGNSTASTYNSTYQYSAPPVTQPYNPGLGVNGNAMLFAPPPTQDHSLKKRKSFFGGLIG